MFIVVCSAKGSPGATSVALALAAIWQGSTPVLIEADPSGGDLAYRCRHRDGGPLAATPSIVSLAAASRGGSASSLDGPAARLVDHTQELACGVRAVPGLIGPAQARGLDRLWPNIARAAVASSEPVIADLGRIGPAGTAFLEAADVVVVVCQGRLESLLHTRELLVDLVAPDERRGHRAPPVLPVVVCARRHATAVSRDVDEVLGQSAIHPSKCTPIHEDTDTLNRLEQGANPHGRLADSTLLRSTSVLVDRLIDIRSAQPSAATARASAVS
jgi:hypothetical protein